MSVEVYSTFELVVFSTFLIKHHGHQLLLAMAIPGATSTSLNIGCIEESNGAKNVSKLIELSNVHICFTNCTIFLLHPQ